MNLTETVNMKPYELLIVDDNADILALLSAMLKNDGYQIRVASNGQEAIKSIANSEPDLLLLDGHMPKMDGFEVCRILKHEKKLECLPIIFLSALADSFNKTQAFEAGADDFLLKPVDPEEIKGKIIMHLRVRSLKQEVKRLRKELEVKNKEIELLRSR